jgi:hypothetical protein
MMNVGRCPRCRKFLVAEEQDSHVCKIACQGVKSIFFDCINDAIEDDNGDTVRVGKGLDGYYYRLIVCKHDPPHSYLKRPPEELPVYPLGGSPPKYLESIWCQV